jgi:hypothetical protein
MALSGMRKYENGGFNSCAEDGGELLGKMKICLPQSLSAVKM